MEEFSALAARVAASVGGLRGCLILSRDGLVLGAFPEGEESFVKPAWLRFATLGEPDKGFVEFGDEVWGYVRRGPYAAFAVTGTTTRPGLLIDQLDQVLLSAEETRTRREALKIPEVPAAPSGKPRTSLHPEVKPPAASPAQTPAASPAQAPVAREASPGQTLPPIAPMRGTGSAETAAPQPFDIGPLRPAPRPVSSEPEAPTPVPEQRDEGADIDRVLLAQEFSRLLQETRQADED
ncbi:MAG: hypothetical protein AB1551_07420 [Actinomycetota bacterium]